MDAEPCYRHPDRLTGRHCTRCGRRACPECLRPASVGSHCPECVRELRPSRAQRRAEARLNPGPPRLTLALIAVNCFVFVLGAFEAGSLYRTSTLAIDYGLFGPLVDAGEYQRLVTSGFLHSGLPHIAFNMIALWFLGRALEPAVGGPLFGAVYAASLLGGSAGALVADPRALTVGASGAIFGLFGLLFTGLRAQGRDPFQEGVGGILLVNLLITFAVPGISIGGHLGGLITGALLGPLVLGPRRRSASAVAAAAGLVLAGLAVALWAAGR